MVCNNFIRNVILQAASVGKLSRRVFFTDIRKGFYERVGFVGSRTPWTWRCATGFRTMMVDTGAAAGNGNGGTVIDVPPPPKDDDSKYSVGGWKSEDGKLSCGFSSFRGKRISMEDFYDVKTSLIDGKPVCLFGVFDGHGGSRAAEYLKDHLFKNLLKHPEFITDTKLAISETYLQTDGDFLNAGRDTYRDDGSTASTAIMVGNHLYVANVGDSRTVASKSGKGIILKLEDFDILKSKMKLPEIGSFVFKLKASVMRHDLCHICTSTVIYITSKSYRKTMYQGWYELLMCQPMLPMTHQSLSKN